MKSVLLEQVATGPETWNPQASDSNQPFQYIDISNIDGDGKLIRGGNWVHPREAPSRARQIVATDDVLVSTVRPNLNAVALVTQTHDGATASTGFEVLRPDQTKVLPSFLFHWVRNPLFVSSLLKRATGANYPAVSGRAVRETAIPLPPLPEQKRIAAILDQAEAIRRKAQERLGLLDQFLRSAFLEMFGDPLRNAQRGSTVPLETVAGLVSGLTKGRKPKGTDLRPTPYLRVANVQDGFLDLAEVKTIDSTEEERSRFALLRGDIVLTEGGDPDKLGRGAVWDGEISGCIHQNHVFRVRLRGNRFLPEYTHALLGSPYGKKYFLRAAKQTTGMAPINRRQLGEFPLIPASLRLQRSYSMLFKKRKEAIDVVESTLAETTHLFHSLSQSAFRGEL